MGRSLILLLLLLALPARAWDAGGHLIVAEIAWRGLKPEVRRELEPLPLLLDRRFNDGRAYHFVTAAVFLDDVKAAPKEYPWSRRHYINLPCGTPPRPPEGAENAWGALQAATATLRDRSRPPEERARALAHVLHIIGDIHQPLHVADRADRGGNGYLLVPIRPPKPGATSVRPFNLHAFWDSAYRLKGNPERHIELWWPPSVRNRPAAPGSVGPIATHATRLLEAHAPTPEAEPWGWIVEAHTLACRHGWPPGPPPGLTEVGRLTPEFVNTAQPLAEAQLARAGRRLAAYLNATLQP